MSDGPQSYDLSARLVELNLCSAQDLRLCRRKIKSLQKNLPIFESTWLDALFAIGRLTHFQVQSIEDDGADSLAIGPYRLLERTRREPYADFLTARSVERTELATLIRLPIPPTEHQSFFDRFAPYLHLAKSRQSSKQTSFTIPTSAHAFGNDIFITEPYHAGITLADLLVRKGRFPVRFVEQITLAVLQSLDQLHAVGLPHGDLRPKNILLTRNGRIILRHPGLTLSRFPIVNFHDPLPHDYFDALPPELFLGQHTYRPASDLFALGSLCWRLLCGRPALLAADPLMKLNRLTRTGLPDIRDFNPDVTPTLAKFIDLTTAIDPHVRVSTTPEAIALLQRARPRWNTSAAARFVASIPATLAPKATLRRPPIVLGYRHGLAAATLLVSAGLIASNQTNTPLIPLKLTDWISQQAHQLTESKPLNKLTSPETATEQTTEETNKLADLPKSDASNVITLTPGQTYTATTLKSDRSLTIECTSETEPAILILQKNQPWQVTSSELFLKNITVRYADPNSDAAQSTAVPNSLLTIQTQNLALDNVTLIGPDASHPGICHAIAWQMSDLYDQTGGNCKVTNSSLQTPGSAVLVQHHFGNISFANTLHHGRGALVQMPGPILPSRGLTVKLAQSTLREVGCLLRLDNLNPRELQGLVQIELQNSVIDVASSQGAMFLLTGNESPLELLKLINVTGRGSILAPETPLAMWFDSHNRQLQPLKDTTLQIDGLMTTTYAFADPAGQRKSDSILISLDGPRMGSTLPGIHPVDTMTASSPQPSAVVPANFEWHHER